jgi:hypothetical protein
MSDFSDLSQWQAAFSNAIHGADNTLTPQIANPQHTSNVQIYRNNYVFGLNAVLQTTYPAVFAFIGEDCFLQLTKLHLRKHPLHNCDVSEYGEFFNQSIESSGLLESLPYLAQLAQWEWQWDHLCRQPHPTSREIIDIQKTLITQHFDFEISRLWQWHYDSDQPPPQNWQRPEHILFFSTPTYHYWQKITANEFKSPNNTLLLWLTDHKA